MLPSSMGLYQALHIPNWILVVGETYFFIQWTPHREQYYDYEMFNKYVQ